MISSDGGVSHLNHSAREWHYKYLDVIPGIFALNCPTDLPLFIAFHKW